MKIVQRILALIGIIVSALFYINSTKVAESLFSVSSTSVFAFKAGVGYGFAIGALFVTSIVFLIPDMKKKQ